MKVQKSVRPQRGCAGARNIHCLLARIVLAIGLTASVSGPSEAATYYASPAGSGDGQTAETPFRIADFWKRARAGDTLFLLDGVYRGSASMIAPPQGLKGESGKPITVRALRDGGAEIDGENARRPVKLSRNDWFVLEGFNAHSADSGGRDSASVVELSRSNHNIVRRICAWDAQDANADVFGVHYSEHNLIEDCAAWGIARKVYSSSQAGNHTTLRRCWGRWEGCHAVGPKLTYTLAYNNYDMLVENCIGTWSGERMRADYTLVDYEGKPWPADKPRQFTDHGVDQPYAIFGVDRLDGDKHARARLLGSIAYVTAHDRFQAGSLVAVTGMDSFEIADTVACIELGSHPDKQTFRLSTIRGGGAGDLRARNLIGLGGHGASFQRDWKVADLLERSDSKTAFGGAQGLLATSAGANLRFRYRDGVLTGEPLWPWPMNRRIIDAMKSAGYAPVDVTATIEKLLGPIPQPSQ